MSLHEIRFCKIEEVQLLCNFIEQHWKKDHVFVQDKKLLDWQHKDIINKRYNFVIALNIISNEFDAILGFIPVNHFDSTLNNYSEIWLALWKTAENKKEKVSGLQLLFYLTATLKPKSIASIGITDNVKNIYDALKYKRGTISHFFIKQEDYDSTIAIIPEIRNNLPSNKELTFEIIEILNFENKINEIYSNDSTYPKKSFMYLKKRYFEHKVYTYKFIGIFLNGILSAVLVIKKIFIGTASCLRIIDWVGEFLKYSIYPQFQELLKLEKSEYIDFLVESEDKFLLFNMGFRLKSEDDIIPEYFEPYTKKNISLEYAYKTVYPHFRIVKGDSDQDRPSLFINNFL